MRPRPLGELSGVQRDLLASMAVNPGSDRRELRTAVEEIRQNTMTDDTIVSNLDELVDYDLVTKANGDGDKIEYRLTRESRELLDKEVEWLDAVR